jgi:basic amino acid/polyamine antiporter, APA family
MFLCAKSASAATAALGVAGYFAATAGIGDGWRILIAIGVTALLTLVVLGGIRQSSRTNILIVCLTLTALMAFCIAGLPVLWENGGRAMRDYFGGSQVSVSERLSQILNAAALMFVAFTGYSRIATLGEEVQSPERTIPRAIIVTLGVSAMLYLGVAAVMVCMPDAPASANGEEAPLEVAARAFAAPAVATLVGIGAITAMLGVLLNLLLGLSRVLLAMGRRGDAPAKAAVLNEARTTPYVAVIVVGAAIAALTLIGDIKVTWSFSAFTVLMYYAITNLAALRMPDDVRRYSVAVSWTGLVACLLLAFRVDRQVWLTGIALIIVGLAWHASRRRYSSPLAP